MASNRYNPTHRQWDHVGNLVPNWEHSEGIRPAMYGLPAPWLPTLFEDKHYEMFVTLMPGKAVAMTCDGFLVPAGLRVDWAAAAGGATILTYTADDVSEKVVDLTTGVVVTAATSYTKTATLTALKARGLVDDSGAIEDYISYPIGLAAQAYYSWGSNVEQRELARELKTFNPADFKFHNFRMQHQVAVLCDYVVRLPWLASDATSEVLDSALTGGAPAYGDDVLVSATDIKSLTRYSDLTGSDFIAWVGPDAPVAKNTTRTPVSADNDTILLRRRGSPDSLTAVGDYFIDYQAGVWFFYVAGGASVPTHVDGATITYNEYTTVPTTISDYVSATGDLKPGSFVEVDADSNFTLSTSSDPKVLMGQVLGFITHPKDKLDRVKTRYRTLGNVNKMPGTATEGMPDTLNLTTTGADTEVIINLITR
jgi:hypothetical protein